MNRFFNYLYKEFIFSGHFMAVGSSILAFVCSYFIGLKPDLLSIISIYLFVQPIYWIDRLIGMDGDKKGNSSRSDHISSIAPYIPYLCLLYFLGFSIPLLIQGKTISFIMATMIFFIGFLYGKFFKGLTRYILGFKNFFVAFFFILFYVYILVYYELPILTTINILLISFIFIRSLLIQIFIDLKDMNDDKAKGLKTFAVKFGKDTTLNITEFLNVLSFFVILIGVISNLLPSYILIFCSLTFLVFHYIYSKSKRDKLSYFLFIFAGQEFIFWILYLIISIGIFTIF